RCATDISSSVRADRKVGTYDQVGPHIRCDGMRLAGLERDRFLEHRSCIHARVKLATLAAWIDRFGQVAQQRAVEVAAAEARIDLSRVDARKSRPKAPIDHLLSEVQRRYSPDRKQRLEPSVRE